MGDESLSKVRTRARHIHCEAQAEINHHSKNPNNRCQGMEGRDRSTVLAKEERGACWGAENVPLFTRLVAASTHLSMYAFAKKNS